MQVRYSRYLPTVWAGMCTTKQDPFLNQMKPRKSYPTKTIDLGLLWLPYWKPLAQGWFLKSHIYCCDLRCTPQSRPVGSYNYNEDKEQALPGSDHAPCSVLGANIAPGRHLGSGIEVATPGEPRPLNHSNDTLRTQNRNLNTAALQTTTPRR